MNNPPLSTARDNVAMKVSPAVVAFEQELENILTRFAKDGKSTGVGYPLSANMGKRKVNFSKLFKEFKPRLRSQYYVEKLMQIGNFLYSVKAFRVAKFQCFTRYLQEIFPDFTCVEEVAGYSLEEYQQIFFARGLDDMQAIDTMKVLYEDIMCSFQLVKEYDPKLQNLASVNRCKDLLTVLRLTTQLALHKEFLSWIVYNGTIHIYTISRHLMITGQSAMVLEYLLWASMCMEASIPLLTVKYLPWRSSLYAAVALCYLDCKESQHAETFARRAMKKITELSDIEDMSTSVSTRETKMIFQSAKVKINSIIFQRVVFELRKRPKGLLRPKARPSLREALHQNWPRSQTERLLSDLFEGSASQFLAILQTLGDPHRRTLQCKAPSGAIDDVTLDIYPELFVAGVDLVCGGNSGTRGSRHDPDVHPSCIELSSTSLIHLSEQGSDGVPIAFVVQLIKLAFSYEQWDVLDGLLQPCISLLKTGSGSELVQTPAYLIALHLLAAMEPFFNTGRKQKKVVSNYEVGLQETAVGNKSNTLGVDDLLVIANILYGSSSELPKSSLPYVDVDMIIDAALFLWSRCKLFFQRVVSCNLDSCRHVTNDTDCDKWLYILLTIHNVLHWSGLSDIDPVMAGEVALKLALVLECRANTATTRPNEAVNVQAPVIPKTELKETKEITGNQSKHKEDVSEITTEVEGSRVEVAGKHYQVVFPNKPFDLLHMAFKILEAGVERVSEARSKTEGTFKNDEKTVEAPDDNGQLPKRPTEIATEIIHLELLNNLARLLVKLNAKNKGLQKLNTVNTQKAKNIVTSVKKQTKKEKSLEESWTTEVMKTYNKNPLTKALLLIHQTQIQDSNAEIGKQQLQVCFDLIKKAQNQHRVLQSKCNSTSSGYAEPTDAPPPPIHIFRSSSAIILKPAPYKPLSKKKVYWYRLFGCSASGSNVKVRLNDSDLVGTGEEVPDGPDVQFHVSNLREGERYVFAVAAYDKNGDIIGGGIGPTGYSIPASHPLPVMMGWGYLTQAAYSCGIYDVAKASAQMLWKHFVPECDITPDESNEKLSFIEGEPKLTVACCDENLLANSNHVLLRQFLQSIFVSVDISVQDGKLYCDALCDYGPLLPGQINRIKQCEKMLVGLQVALWLNDNSLVLQIVTRCYGLLAPLVQLKIPSKPVVQILLHCYAVLQEIPSLSRYRKNSGTSDSLYHLIAVITYYLTKVLTVWGEQDLANAIKEWGRKLLSIDPPLESAALSGPVTQSNDGQAATENFNTKSLNKKATKTKVGAKKMKTGLARPNLVQEQVPIPGNYQRKEFLALESCHSKLSCDLIMSQRHELELFGTEDSSILTAYIAAMIIQDAFKEVFKFRKRAKYLEYFVHLLEKTYAEDGLEQVLDWSNETEQWFIKRHDQLIPMRDTPLIRIAEDFGGDETKQGKFATAILEYGKPTIKKSQVKDQRVARQILDGMPDVKQDNTGSSDKATSVHKIRKDKFPKRKGRTPEQQELISAIESLRVKLPVLWRTEGRRRRLRAITNEELPWRCQWNILRGLAALEMFLKNLKKHKMSRSESTAQDSFRASFMGTDWFNFDVSGTLVPRSGKETSPQIKAAVTSFLQNTPKIEFPKKSQKEQLKIDDPTSPESFKYICNASKYLSQAVVLSSRGKCWGLLQNASTHLWNFRQKLQEVVNDPITLLSEELLQDITWRAFYHAADALLDMILFIQSEKTGASSKNKSSTKVPTDVTFWGDLEEEKGGSDLIFEKYLDDQTVADVVWIKRVVMHSMELLFHQKKWERLADIILRFNVLTRGRYAENILPVLAIAQRKLVERAEENGGLSINQPEVVVSPETGKPEGLTITLSSYCTIDPAFHIDPRGHDLYTKKNDALHLFSVPINTSNTLQMLKQSLELKHCAARALQHSRQLLLRYLAGLCQQKKYPSRVGFAPSEDQGVTALPPNLSEQKFEKVDEIQKLPLAPSQLAVVITSYDKTIEMLQLHGRKALLAQAMSEIGNIMLHIGNIRSAFKWWQAVLDTILSPIASSSKHNQQSESGYHNAAHVSPSVLLKKRGMWGCLLGAITAVNIARYIHTENTDKRLEFCCVAASLLKALFSSSLPHPTACCDFALYDIGNGFPVGNLIPGVNLFSDPFRCDVKVLLTSVLWLAEELTETGHCLMVLPLLTLARYISCDIFGNETLVSKVLLLRLRALTSAGMFPQSCVVLNSLFAGKFMKHLSKNQVTKIQNAVCLHGSKPLTDASNIEAITNLICLRLPPHLVAVYGSEQSRNLMLEQARLMIGIASTIYATPVDVKQQLAEKLAGETTLDISTELFGDNASNRMLKSYLLAGAELLLGEIRNELLGPQHNLREFLDARGQHFKTSEFKCLILIELELANITEQHLESLSAAKIVHSCMRALEDASVLLEHDQKRFGSAWTAFSRSSDITKTPELLRDDFIPVKTELNPHLWLTCRTKMVEFLSCEDNSVGRIAGSSRTVVAFTGSCEQHCEQGIDEADAFGNSEVLIELQLAALLLKLQHGSLAESDIVEMKNAIDILKNVHPLSVKGRLMLVKMLIYYGDFIGSYGDSKEDPNFYYKQAETRLHNEMNDFGEKLEYCSEKSSVSLQNTYLPHILLLAECKLRLGQRLRKTINESSDVKSINEVLDVFKEGLTLARAMNTEHNPLESVFLYFIGNLRRLLWLNGECSEKVVISSFFDAIKITYNFDCNLELMKECYEQLVLFYLGGNQKVKPELAGQTKPGSGNTSSKIPRVNSKLQRKDDKAKDKTQEKKGKLVGRKELKATWFAIRAAASVTAVFHKRGLLLGDVTHLRISKETGNKIPKCVIHDVLGAISVVADQDDGSWMKDDGVVTMESYINGSKTVQITWVHLLTHAQYLQRQTCYQSLGVKSAALHSGPLFRWQKLLKLCQMHHLLTTELDVYQETCSGFYLSPLLLLADVSLYEKYYTSTGKTVDEADEFEVSIHWLFIDSHSKEQSCDVQADNIQCLYALNKKAVRSGSKTPLFAGSFSTSFQAITDVHKQLRVLLELAETDLRSDVPSKPSKQDIAVSQSSSTVAQTSRKRRTAGIRSLSPRGIRRDQIQVSFKECLSSLTRTIKPSLLSDKKEAPFEPSWENIRTLESMFDPSRGFIGKVPEAFYTWVSSMFL